MSSLSPLGPVSAARKGGGEKEGEGEGAGGGERKGEGAGEEEGAGEVGEEEQLEAAEARIGKKKRAAATALAARPPLAFSPRRVPPLVPIALLL